MMNKILPGLCLIQALVVALWAESCSEPPQVPNSVWNIDTSNGTKVTYRCTKGQLFGEQTLFCNASRQWHASPPVCKEACGKPRPIEHAKLQYPADEISVHAVGAKVHYACSLGYYATSGLTESICRHDFTWSDPALVCAHCSKKSTCEEASDSWKVPELELSWLERLYDFFHSPSSHCMKPRVENGEITSEGKERYSAEDTVTFQCSAGFQLEGSPYVTCTENGGWKPELPKCMKYTTSNMKEFLYHGKKLEDLKPRLELYKLSLEIQKLELEIKQKQEA
ncbi:zona pellucida sperm-binding protein 3 receptor isoform X1 [Microcaecilia unicolor]|uniref:C4b-binding protein beta chain isoform X1 n=1 Tax=Microcaecilia unicolor TaxID=1415580 RepID=A0A6P7ZU31_9AMPH|nr:C4b-binding protein beta chain isoform X1 [Microcaecilia unicolor]XP_030076579.1 C4b-binding protein beta chain isoform X1 [Microcaecilia unicolor]XP_030076580.1 C4b-binding protein beta chain isoform X1 [Microcaecilia unicolor]